MQIKIDNKVIKELSAFQVQAIIDRVSLGTPDANIEELLVAAIEGLYRDGLGNMRGNWYSRLVASGIESVPTKDEAFVQTIFDSKVYKDTKTTRDSRL